MSLEDVHVLFGQEADELLTEMEDGLLALEEDPGNLELLNSVFRAMHTIKGAAGIFGFSHIVEFTHPLETELDRVRSNSRQVDGDLIALLLQCKDHTHALVAAAIHGEQPITPALAVTSEQLLSQLNPSSQKSAGDKPASAAASPLANEMALQAMFASDMSESISPDENAIPVKNKDHWLICVDFHLDAFRNGFDPISFIRYLKSMGEILDIVALTSRVPHLIEGDFESCFLGYRLAFSSPASKQDIEAVFEFACEDCEISILPSKTKVEAYIKLLESIDGEAQMRLGDMLVNIGAITPRELEAALGKQQAANASGQATGKKLGELLIDSRLVYQPVVEEALKKQQKVREQAQTIRVDSNKLGQLVNLVGELVTASAAMRVMVNQHQIVDDGDVISGVEHLVEEIRDHALQLRMVQIGETFSRFKRVTRDVSNELGKKIDLLIEGGESELDKTVVEKMNDPLTHLVRNALDHGIEPPEIRRAAGKPETGQVTLNAYHESGQIVIEVIDDGAGLNPDKIRAKAEAIGLVDAGQLLSKAEIFSLVFEPGLSTKQQASNLSGRGVGMDVVKRNIQALRGHVELDSEPGRGTKVTITLPLTLAIIDGFMVGAANERYVIPLSMVEECVELSADQWQEKSGQNFINLRGELMPYLRLKDFFGSSEARPSARESLVVVRFGRQKAGFVVDRLYGEQQTVIKPLGAIFQHLKGVSGATILGTGKLALIIDVQGLISLVAKNNKSPIHS